ncbi:type I polyketide synthase [Nocardia harenae]|uniref:type I polyketide synthase n=1 Tax=Nocardia harenae TaxID=358707 RepID=UPI00083533A5|nr:type I polyketide synthase [Nocardia harenae]
MSEPIALVGIGCRFPGSRGTSEFWDVLSTGRDTIGEVPADRWSLDEFFAEQPGTPGTPGKMNTRWGGFLDDIDGFDADFFGISRREAERMDPQQRIALEVAYEALADAGIPIAHRAAATTGVYFGASTYDHGAAMQAAGTSPGIYDGTGAALSIIANRVSYSLNLRGPSLVIDTACSSSLVAMHLACQALRAGEVDVAIAGGVNVITSPGVAIIFSQGGLMAPDGRCKTFDHRADGYVRSEGAGAVVLKPLSEAEADGDRIYAVVLGGATNHDGKTNGLTAPSRIAQVELLRAAYRAAQVDPAAVDYVEAHGTGTAVGDPIEVSALAQVLGAGRETALRVGSAKTNVGHLEAAAGIAGVIKLALTLHHRTLTPTVHFERPNPLLGLDRVPVVVQQRREPWPATTDRAPLAGVSSFGFGGTNAHLVLSGAPIASARDAASEPAGADRAVLLPISAQSEEQLASRAASWAALADEHAGDACWLAAAAGAAALRTGHQRHRMAAVVRTAGELAAGLRAGPDTAAPGVAGPRARAVRTPRVAFVFPGQGPQWIGMGRRLAATVPVFRDAIRECDAALAPLLGTALWDDGSGLTAVGTAQVQPALFAIQVALARTWTACGVQPSAVIGHSMGEVAAACVSGSISLADAARIVCARSTLATEISGRGALAVLELDAAETAELLAPRAALLSVAAVNGPRTTVVSGAAAAVDELVAEMSERGIFARRIAVEFAAHSPQVEPLLPRLRAALTGLTPAAGAVPIYSTVHGGLLPGADLGVDYWLRNFREPVLFGPTVEQVLADGNTVLVEIAPHPVLGHALNELIRTAGTEATVLTSLDRDADEQVSLLTGLGEAYTHGVAVDWSALYPDAVPHTDLPEPGWDHQPFPPIRLAAPDRADAAPAARSGAGLLGRRIPVGVDPSMRLWALPFDSTNFPELADHTVDDLAVVPGAYWLGAVTEALGGAGPVVLGDVEFLAPHPVTERGAGLLQLALLDSGREFRIVSAVEPTPVEHARGRVLPAGDDPVAVDPDGARARCGTAASLPELYARLEELGLHYGPAFRGLSELACGDGEALGRIRRRDGTAATGGMLHPALLDACLHTVAAAVGGETAAAGALPLPVGVERVWAATAAAAPATGWAHARIRLVRGHEVLADVSVWDDSGEIVWQAIGFAVRTTAPRRAVDEGRLYRLRWDRQALGAATAGDGRTWALLGGGELAAALTASLTAAGDRAHLLTAADQLQPETAELGPIHAVVDLRAVAAAHTATAAATAGAALRLARELAGRSDRPALWLVTAGTQELAATVASPGAGYAAVWGLGRAIATELPGLRCGLVDLSSPEATADDVAGLAATLRSREQPGQAIVRAGAVLVPRLVPAPPRAGAEPKPVRTDRTHLITGGFGALGQALVEHLLGRGARHVVLASRRGDDDPAARALLTRWRAATPDLDIRAARLDVADGAAIAALVAEIQASGHPLSAVYHAAGVLADALVTDLDDTHLTRAITGKALGAQHLHEATVGLPLDDFVLFSSLAGILGSPGQAAYAAANTVLDTIAVQRAAAGLPAVSIAWGTWAGASLASAGVDRLAARGLPPLRPEIGLELLTAALASELPVVVAAAFRPEGLGRSLASAPPATRTLLEPIVGSLDQPRAVRGAALAAVRAAQTDDARRDVVARYLTERVAAVLGTTPADVDPRVPFQEVGMDSLTAIELRDQLETAFDTRLSAALFFAHPTVESFADELAARLGTVAPASAAAPDVADGEPDGGEPDDDDLSALSDDELTDLVERELGLIRGSESA